VVLFERPADGEAVSESAARCASGENERGDPGQRTGGYRYVGRWFSEADLEMIRRLCTDPAYPSRAAISRAVCEELSWHKPDGGLKDMSARVALAAMAADGFITLPAPIHRLGVPSRHLAATIEQGPPLCCPLRALGAVELTLVRKGPSSPIWNELIGRFHYLGYTRLSGAQLRYLVTAKGQLLGAIGFGAAAWTLRDRDAFIGWGTTERKARLHLVVGNPRFLIVPWVRVPHLASHVLGRVTRRLRADWLARYGYAPVLVETFVEVGRHAGSCYKAANWTHVGRTAGRGKLDRHNRYALAVKDIYCYPLVRGFRHQLLGQGRER